MVESAETVGGGANFDVEIYVYEPNGLKRLPEVLRRIFRYNATVFRNSKKLFFALFVLAGGSLSFGFFCHSVGVDNEALALDDAGFPVVDFLLVFLGGAGSLCNVFPAFIHISLEPYRKNLFVVTGGLTGNAVSKPYGDDIVLDTFFGVDRKGSL